MVSPGYSSMTRLYLPLVLAYIVQLSAVSGVSPIKVWIDCDPSIGVHDVDDGFALWQATLSANIDVVGVSTVFGNAPLLVTRDVAERVVRGLFLNSSLVVRSGASSDTELGLISDASKALSDVLATQRLTIVSLGPLTNIATVVLRNASVVHNIDRIVSVAGRREGQSFIVGSGTKPIRDLNFEMDVESYRVILNTEIPLTLVPYEVSSTVWVRREHLTRISDASRGHIGVQWLVTSSLLWIDWWQQSFQVEAFNPFDSLAVGFVSDPALFSCEQSYAEIRYIFSEDTPQLIARRTAPSANGKPVQYCYAVHSNFTTNLLSLFVEGAVAISSSEHHSYTSLFKTFGD